MSEYREDELLQLSGLQHFVFCRRQWALIHIEQQWQENFRTADGEIFHQRTHDETLSERRGDLLITRGMQIFSRRLGISGTCDVLEFHREEGGVTLAGVEGLWRAFPIEYKRGEPKTHNADELQLCAQAMCLEEMLATEISAGALFYGETKRRLGVDFTPDLRRQVEAALAEMHQLFGRGYTPMVKPSKACSACSLNEICMAKLTKTQRVSEYLLQRQKEDLP